MLRHTGQKRGFRHNLRLSVLLCLNAGFINAAGILAFSVLTTNVTGHAAHLAVALANGDFRTAWIPVLWILLFFTGAFCSGMFIAVYGRHKSFVYSIPLFCVIILVAGTWGAAQMYRFPGWEVGLPGALLLAMGMQNALVTMVSGSVVRTTHLTGIVTDLGIDLAALAFSRQGAGLARRVALRLVIILSFIAGGIGGAYGFIVWGYDALLVSLVLLLMALFYDQFRVGVKRRIRYLRP